MSSGPPHTSREYVPNEALRASTLLNRLEDPTARQQRLQRTGTADVWSQQATSSLSIPPPGIGAPDLIPAPYSPFAPQQRMSREEFAQRQASGGYQDLASSSTWPGPPSLGRYANQSPMSASGGPSSSRGGYSGYQSWPAPLLRRTSSDDTRLSQYGGSQFGGSQFGGSYYGVEASASSPSLHMKAYPQRRPSNRDEFDGPSQLLDKPEDSGYEPKEEELPQLPITLYAQEQDEILSKVNDRLSQCTFDFVAKYQFPVPIEPDKRPVRVPGDREWSEWVYLLKRLATKRRIPARVLYNGQINELITILENSVEMRHAAKHQSRPLKDDRNILQLISSGLQVAKIVKDATAMQYLDSLYVQTERLIQGRRGAAGGFGAMCLV